MTIMGMIIGIVLGIGLTFVIGPYGVVLLIAILFGMAFSAHLKSNKIYEDLQRIKEKLGIIEKDDFNMKNEEIEKELEESKENQYEEKNHGDNIR